MTRYIKILKNLKYSDDLQRVFISLHSVTNSSTENAIGKACPDLEYAVMRHAMREQQNRKLAKVNTIAFYAL